MKKLYLSIIGIILILSFAACSIKQEDSDYFGFDKKNFTVVEETDHHGGFHGDGKYLLVLDCSENKERASSVLSGWNKLPLSENLDLIMYGGRKNGVSYAFHLAEEANIPKIEHGYYYFCDRHSMSKDSRDDAELLDRHSFNFSLGLYDSDADRMYYYEFDT